ncbi:EMC3/TMCO1 family protein [Candidatus Undinarchaeota archaeon]
MGIIFTLLDPIFSPVLSLGNIYAILILSIIINIISAVMTKAFVDMKRMKEIQEELKKNRTKMIAASKEGKDTKDSTEDQARLMEMQQEMMKLQFPMFFTMIPILLVFMWMREVFPQNTHIITLPYSLPIWGNVLGWIGWYILCSIPISTAIRKGFRVA